MIDAQLEFWIGYEPRTKKLILCGDLDDSPVVRAMCRNVLGNFPKFVEMTVGADEARVDPRGVTLWIETVNSFLSGCKLTYAPSQLALILQYDDRYTHSNSIFRE